MRSIIRSAVVIFITGLMGLTTAYAQGASASAPGLEKARQVHIDNSPA